MDPFCVTFNTFCPLFGLHNPIGRGWFEGNEASPLLAEMIKYPTPPPPTFLSVYYPHVTFEQINLSGVVQSQHSQEYHMLRLLYCFIHVVKPTIISHLATIHFHEHH